MLELPAGRHLLEQPAVALPPVEPRHEERTLHVIHVPMKTRVRRLLQDAPRVLYHDGLWKRGPGGRRRGER